MPVPVPISSTAIPVRSGISSAKSSMSARQPDVVSCSPDPNAPNGSIPHAGGGECLHASSGSSIAMQSPSRVLTLLRYSLISETRLDISAPDDTSRNRTRSPPSVPCSHDAERHVMRGPICRASSGEFLSRKIYTLYSNRIRGPLGTRVPRARCRHGISLPYPIANLLY